MTAPDSIGQAVGRAEGPEKVTGQALFPGDIRKPGMLTGLCLRSPHPHARIRAIDASRARQVPGVHAVLTGADLPHIRVGRDTRDIDVLARERVLFAGQKVAAVAAETSAAAQEALDRIQVEYEPLPAILDLLDATSDGAPTLHPDFDTYEGIAPDPRDHPNIVAQRSWGRGDIDAGFAASDRIFEHRFRTQHQHQGYIEPHACVVEVKSDGSAEVWANCKMPFQLRAQIARGVGIEPERVRINPAFIGGDFGGKGGFMDTHVAYWLSRHSGRPVSMRMSYSEELAAANPRHPAVMTFRTGVKNDGTIVVRHATLVFDSGGSAAFRPVRGIFFGVRCLGPYRMEHSRIDSSLVYTNHVPCGSMRSPGDPQSIFASEAQIDLIARELGMDPLAFRRQNLIRDGDLGPLGQRFENPIAGRVLDEAARASGYGTPLRSRPGRRVGRGLAICERSVGTGRGVARVRVDTGGQVTLCTALRDTGAGFYTILRQIVGRELGVPYDQVALETLSTDEADADSGVGGARVTNVGGHATYEAARAIRRRLEALVHEHHGFESADLRFESGLIRSPGHEPLSLAQVVAECGAALEEEFTYDAKPAAGTVFAAQAAEVEIDDETGQIQLTRFTTVHDVGQVLNPIAHQGQIEGGLLQGIGQTLMEELVWDDGRVANASLADYKLPTAGDIPELETILVKSPSDGPGPYGGKAIGEQSISTVAPAIVNAVLDATGVSFRELPLTAERVYRSLREPRIEAS